mgnify:CR=1 FL=1
MRVADFSRFDGQDQLFETWIDVPFRSRKKSEYQLNYAAIDGNRQKVLYARSKSSASAIIKRVDIDLETHPIMSWRWKVEDILEKGDVTRKSGDDYAARIYLTFDYPLDSLAWSTRWTLRALRLFYERDQIPNRAINYVWANKAERGTIVESPYTHLTMMVAANSGTKNAGEWVTVKRNVYKDYKKAFGGTPPPITGIAIMTDSDDTGEMTKAWIDEIVFLKE